MAIENIFDNKTKPVLSPLDLISKSNNLVEACIVTFSKDVFDYVLSNYKNEYVNHAGTGDGTIGMYIIEINNKKYGFYKTPIGAPWASMILEDAHVILGATKFLVFGSCGVINNEVGNRIVVPTESYRDEGTSYHYVAASETIKIKNADKVAAILDDLKVPYIKGKSWTTDGFYRETSANINKRREQGCLVVEMESSALQAVSDNKGFEFYTFFFGGDVLSSGTWEQANLSNQNEIKKQYSTFDVAIEVLTRL